jgi:flagellar hook-basal body complex protein FliE
MSISSISAIGSVLPTTPIQASQGASATSGADFGKSMAGAVDSLQGLQATSDSLAVQAVTGNLDDIHNATIAATRAQVSLELVAAVRNKGVDAFNEIMRMQA